jgi:hypothetical protein
MSNNTTYEAPEIFELGKADEMTLGQVALPCPDACDCSKEKADDEEVMG